MDLTDPDQSKEKDAGLKAAFNSASFLCPRPCGLFFLYRPCLIEQLVTNRIQCKSSRHIDQSMLLQEDGGKDDQGSQDCRTAQEYLMLPEGLMMENCQTAADRIEYMNAGENIGRCVQAI